MKVCGGGTAKSCAIVRSHYSVPSNTALTLRSLEMFGAFKDWLADPLLPGKKIKRLAVGLGWAAGQEP